MGVWDAWGQSASSLVDASSLLPALPLSLQSRRAYAEIRPRIKGRFVTPEASQPQRVGREGRGRDAEANLLVHQHLAPDVCLV